MNLQGKGHDLGDDIPKLMQSADNHESFKEKYGMAAFDICFDSFIMPILIAKTKEEGEEIAKRTSNKISLFCAAFV